MRVVTWKFPEGERGVMWLQWVRVQALLGGLAGLTRLVLRIEPELPKRGMPRRPPCTLPTALLRSTALQHLCISGDRQTPLYFLPSARQSVVCFRWRDRTAHTTPSLEINATLKRCNPKNPKSSPPLRAADTWAVVQHTMTSSGIPWRVAPGLTR